MCVPARRDGRGPGGRDPRDRPQSAGGPQQEGRGSRARRGAGLSLVIRAGAGIDTIDVAAASRLGIFVSNCPGKNSIAVAELVLGLLLSMDRRIPDQVIDLRQGEWQKGEYSKARGLHGRTLGILGVGQIGREVARRAQAFGMKVVAWSRNSPTKKPSAWVSDTARRRSKSPGSPMQSR